MANGWSGTPAEKRAYALKKARERASVQGHKPLKGFRVSPDKHRCGAHDLETVNHSGTSIPGRRCTVCGREWRYTPGNDGRPPFREVIPVTEKMPNDGNRPPSTVRRAEPTGRLGEMPPDELTGRKRGLWWSRYAEERLKLLLGHEKAA